MTLHHRHALRAALPIAAFSAAILAGTAERGPVVRSLIRLAAAENAEGAADAEDTRTITFVLSDDSVDSYNTTLDPTGWSFDRTGAGTVVLYGHNPGDPLNVVGRCHNVRVDGRRLLGDVTFMAAEVNARAEAVYQMVRGGFINSCSVGFDPIEWSPSKTRKGGVDFKRQELLELSIVPIPSNKNALVLARAAGIDVDQLPAPETRVVGRMLTRDLYDVGNFADVISWLAYITSSAGWEAEYEGDGSDIPGRLAELLKSAGTILVDMTAEEVGELIARVTGESESRAASLAFARGVSRPRGQRSADPQTVVTGALLADRELRQQALDAFDAILAGEAVYHRAGKVISSANETSLREAHGLLTRAAEQVLAVAGSNASAEGGTDDDAEQRARAEEATRLRRAKALQQRAALATIAAAA